MWLFSEFSLDLVSYCKHMGTKPANHLLRISAMNLIIDGFYVFEGFGQVITNKLLAGKLRIPFPLGGGRIEGVSYDIIHPTRVDQNGS
jgi:hypothetical protein